MQLLHDSTHDFKDPELTQHEWSLLIFSTKLFQLQLASMRELKNDSSALRAGINHDAAWSPFLIQQTTAAAGAEFILWRFHLGTDIKAERSPRCQRQLPCLTKFLKVHV